jgi:hypothetical protein
MVLDPQAVHRFRHDPFNAETPLPAGMELPAGFHRPAPPPNQQPMQSNIRGLIQRLRGMNPTPAGDPPPAEAPPFAPGPPVRSVLRRP